MFEGHLVEVEENKEESWGKIKAISSVKKGVTVGKDEESLEDKRWEDGEIE